MQLQKTRTKWPYISYTCMGTYMSFILAVWYELNVVVLIALQSSRCDYKEVSLSNVNSCFTISYNQGEKDVWCAHGRMYGACMTAHMDSAWQDV